MIKEFVIFYSPETMVAESTAPRQKEIDSWDVEKAEKMARGIKKRYDAIPYGFQFVTREQGDKDFDSHETKRSNMYYLSGIIWTLSELEARNDPNDHVLISNMKRNGWATVIESNNSWKWVQPLFADDVILKGDEP